MKEVSLEPKQRVRFKITPLGPDNDPREIEPGTLDYKSQDETQVLAVEDPLDETRVLIKTPAGAVPDATFNVTVSADADLGAGVQTLTETIAVTILRPRARRLFVEQDGEIEDDVETPEIPTGEGPATDGTNTGGVVNE